MTWQEDLLSKLKKYSWRVGWALLVAGMILWAYVDMFLWMAL